MPVISRFDGIVITMYAGDHPPPHFHVRYGEWRARLSIVGLVALQGRLPPRVRAKVVRWADLHQRALRANWDRCEQDLPPQPIPPPG